MNVREGESNEWFKRDDPWQVRLRKMRDLVSDEIPPEIIHSISPNRNFKVTKAWWTGLFAIFENAIEDREIDGPLARELEAFMEDFRAQGFFDQNRLTTELDIQRANGMITQVLGEDSEIP